MATTFLSDNVINATELRKNQKHWLAKATQNVITIVNGNKHFALINRERISKLYAQNHYSELALIYHQEISQKRKSTAFPWTEYLSKEEKTKFCNELLDCIIKSNINDDWSSVDNLIEDWKATAEVNSNPEIAKALLAEEDPSEYVEIKD